jgi:hypothetical protein
LERSGKGRKRYPRGDERQMEKRIKPLLDPRGVVVEKILRRQ